MRGGFAKVITFFTCVFLPFHIHTSDKHNPTGSKASLLQVF